MKHELIQPIRGIVPPLCTPLTETMQLDVDGFERLIEHVVAGGVHGLFLLGTTGEGPSLSRDVQRDVIRHASHIVDRRVPLLVSISHSCLAESVNLAQFATDAGCDAVVATPPYFYPLCQGDVLEYYKTLLQQLPLPLMLYNMPVVAGSHVEFETARKFVEHEQVLGLKDSSGDIETFREFTALTNDRPDFSLLVGPEHLLAETLAMGGVGGVSGGANVWPQLFVRLYEAALEDDHATANKLHQLVEQFGETYRVGPLSIPAIIARTKSALAICGVCSDATAPPVNRASDSERDKITIILDQLPLDEIPQAGKRFHLAKHSSISEG